MQSLKFSFPNVPYELEDVKQLTVTPIWSMQPEGVIGVYHIAASLEFGEASNQLEVDGEAIEHVEFHYPNGYFEYAYPIEFDQLEGHVEQLAVENVHMTIEQGHLVVEWDVQVAYEDRTDLGVEGEADSFVPEVEKQAEELVLHDEREMVHELPVVEQIVEEQAEAQGLKEEVIQVEYQPVVNEQKDFALEEQPFLEELKEHYTLFQLNKIGQ